MIILNYFVYTACMNCESSYPIDFTKAMEITGNDTELFETLMEVFVQSNSEYISQISKAVSNRNANDLRLYAHQAKSGLVSIGATIASQFAREMEDMGKKSNFTNIDEIFRVFKEELNLIEEYANNKNWIKKE